MQTILGTRQLKMGLSMLNMQFKANNGFVWNIQSSKINNIENLNNRCFANLQPFVSFNIHLLDSVHSNKKIRITNSTVNPFSFLVVYHNLTLLTPLYL